MVQVHSPSRGRPIGLRLPDIEKKGVNSLVPVTCTCMRIVLWAKCALISHGE